MLLPQNVVIVEDEIITQRYIQDIFAQYGISVSGCFDNAKETLTKIQDVKCDMILMDINIKGAIDGIQLAKQLLKTYTFPLIFITAHNDDATLDELLELAPYGFVGKPFSSKELIATIKIAYKRYLTHSALHNIEAKEDASLIVINDKYRYSQKEYTLFCFDEVIKLNRKQVALVNVLSENANHIVHYETIIEAVWGSEEIADSALRTLVYSVRKLLSDFPIVSYSKMGYTLVCK